MSGSLESVLWNAYVHRLDLGLFSHPKKFSGMEPEPTLSPREKFPLSEHQRRFKPATLHQALGVYSGTASGVAGQSLAGMTVPVTEGTDEV